MFKWFIKESIKSKVKKILRTLDGAFIEDDNNNNEEESMTKVQIFTLLRVNKA